jgi:SEC-C motif domain protein
MLFSHHEDLTFSLREHHHPVTIYLKPPQPTMHSVQLSALLLSLGASFAPPATAFQFLLQPPTSATTRSLAFLLYAKKATNKHTRASSSKGFGAAPLTVEQYASTLPTRLPKDVDTTPCPCGGSSSSLYAQCCQPFHQGLRYPSTPLQVLQSRYTAFQYRLPMYIMQTSHPTCSDYRNDRMEWLKDLHKSGMFDGYHFVRLVPGALTSGSHEDEAFVEFEVHFQDKNPLNRKTPDDTIVFRERSRFLRDAPHGWRYTGGEVQLGSSPASDSSSSS